MPQCYPTTTRIAGKNKLFINRNCCENLSFSHTQCFSAISGCLRAESFFTFLGTPLVYEVIQDVLQYTPEIALLLDIALNGWTIDRNDLFSVFRGSGKIFPSYAWVKLVSLNRNNTKWVLDTILYLENKRISITNRYLENEFILSGVLVGWR